MLWTAIARRHRSSSFTGVVWHLFSRLATLLGVLLLLLYITCRVRCCLFGEEDGSMSECRSRASAWGPPLLLYLFFLPSTNKPLGSFVRFSSRIFLISSLSCRFRFTNTPSFFLLPLSLLFLISLMSIPPPFFFSFSFHIPGLPASLPVEPVYHQTLCPIQFLSHRGLRVRSCRFVGLWLYASCSMRRLLAGV